MKDELPASPTRNPLLARLSEVGSTAQAAIPGLYAWVVTVAPAAWSRGAPTVAKVAAALAVIALLVAPLIENASRNAVVPSRWLGPATVRICSIWGFVLPCVAVWAIVPAALSSAKFDGVRGVLGTIGWALFAFASAGPTLRVDPEARGRAIASQALKPRSSIPRGDGAYIAVGAAIALAMQAVGWQVATSERAVLVRLLTIVFGIAVIGAMTSIALARHSSRVTAPPRTRLRRALPWFALLAIAVGSGITLALQR